MKFARIVNHLWTDVDNERASLKNGRDDNEYAEICNRIEELINEMELYRLSSHYECEQMREKLETADFKGLWAVYNDAMKKYNNRKI